MKTLLTIYLLIFAFFQPIEKDKKTERIDLLNQVFETLEKNIANPSWLEDGSYRDFKKKMYSGDLLVLDDKAFIKAFREGTRELPFTHFSIRKIKSKNSSNTSNKENRPAITWKSLDSNTAYLKIRSFSIGPEPMAKAILEIGTDTYKNLIIDLRGNGGGSIDAPVVLGQFLTQEPINAGYYLTRKWFENHENLPTPEELRAMPYLKDFSFSGIRKLFDTEEGFITAIPGHERPVFQGKVYVLIDGATGSACEPLIDIFKKKNIATLVGETSYGGMLSGHYFDIDENYHVFIPIADYYTEDGSRIDKVGVKPDIIVDSDKAKSYVLDLISKSK